MKKTISTIALYSLILYCSAQPLPDSALLNMSQQELGLHFLQKSKNQKAAGYVFAGIATASFIAVPFVFAEELNGTTVTGTLALSIIGFGSTATSLAFLSAGNKNAGKAQMLLRTKSPDEVPGYELTLGMQYEKKAYRQRMIGYALLASGFTMMLIAPELNDTENYESSGNAGNIVALGGTVATFASLPFLLSAAKNKGRASVLLKKESIPFSYYSRPIGLNSLAISMTLGK